MERVGMSGSAKDLVGLLHSTLSRWWWLRRWQSCIRDLGTVRVWAGVVEVKAGMGWVFCGLPEAPGSGVGAAWWSGCREGRPCVLPFMAVV